MGRQGLRQARTAASAGRALSTALAPVGVQPGALGTPTTLPPWSCRTLSHDSVSGPEPSALHAASHPWPSMPATIHPPSHRGQLLKVTLKLHNACCHSP